MVRILKLISKTAVVGALALGIGSCAYTPANTQDLQALRREIARNGEVMESSIRQMRGEIGTLNNNLETNTSQLKSSVDDISRQMNQQQKDIADLKERIASTPTPTPTPAPTPAPVQYPDFVSALNAGKQALAAQNVPAARDAFAAALNFANAEPNPDKAKAEQVEANFWAGEAAFAARDYSAAEADYRNVIRLDKQSISAWQSYERLGDIDMATGNNAAALQKYQAILNNWKAKGQRYQGESQVQAKIAQIQQGGGAAAPAPGAVQPPAGQPPVGAPAPVEAAPGAPASGAMAPPAQQPMEFPGQ